MSPTRKLAAAPKKQNRSPDDEPAAKRQVQIDSDKDVTETVTPDTPSSFLKRIWEAQSKKAGYTGVGRIKDILQVDELYDILDIKEINARHGPRQVWTVKCLKDGEIKKIFSCIDLHRFTSDDDGSLDLEKKNDMINQVRILYKGYRKFRHGTGAPSKCDFKFLQK